MIGIDPVTFIRRWRGLPYFLKNLWRYRSMQKSSAFPLKGKDIYYTSFDRFHSAGTASGHYFWQDLWAARYLYHNGVREHVDVGSRIDGFVAHILPFCHATYVDCRAVKHSVPNLSAIQASILSLPFKSYSLHSLSCLHVIEHIGLGRYGDPVDPYGHEKAAKELTRVLHKNGILLIGVPVGQNRLCFDAHRIFDPGSIENMFSPLKLEQFSLVNDNGQLVEKAGFEEACRCDYGCGLFIFKHNSMIE